MADDRTVPPSPQEQGPRMQSRPAGSDFARLPADEVHAREPGGGPHGTVTSGSPNYPLVLVAVGFLVIFTAFGLDSGWPVAAGVLLILVGGIWGGVRSSDPTPDRTHSSDAGTAESDPAADREPAGRQAEAHAEADDRRSQDPETTKGNTIEVEGDQAPPSH